MPGENCCVVGCGSCRRHKGLGIFKVPAKSKDENGKSKHGDWRDTWLNEIKKHRVVDQAFKEQIAEGNVYTCEKHFHKDDIEIRKCYSDW